MSAPTTRDNRFADRMLRAYRDSVAAAIGIREAARFAPVVSSPGPGRAARLLRRLRPGGGQVGWSGRGGTDFERLIEAWNLVYRLSSDLHEGSRRAWLAAGRSEASWLEELSDLEDLGGLL